MTVAGQTEEVTVIAEAPLIDVKDSGVGEIVTADADREPAPERAAVRRTWRRWCPGVSLGFHTDPTKSTQFAPQVAGGGGRNINYLIDGGDNNDDTVGGLVQNFPLDSIGEFNFETQRFRADTGRANGGTHQGRHQERHQRVPGSVFELFRDKSLNAQDRDREAATSVDKGDYKQAPVRSAAWAARSSRTRPTSSSSFERIAAGHAAVGEHAGALSRTRTASSTCPTGRTWSWARSRTSSAPTTTCPSATASTTTTRSTGPARRRRPRAGAISKNTFHSANANLNSVLGSGKLNEFTFQFSYFQNQIVENSNLPYGDLSPTACTVGQIDQHPADHRAAQVPVPRRLHLEQGAARVQGGGELHLRARRSTSRSPPASRRSSRTSPTAAPRRSRTSRTTAPSAAPGAAARPRSRTTSTRFYLQDAWRVNDKLTLDLGVRYDLVTGFAFDQDKNIIFAELQAAAQRGRVPARRAALPLPGLRGLRPGAEGGHEQHLAAGRLHLRRQGRRPASSSAAASAATTTSPTPTRTSCSRWSAPSRPSARSTRTTTRAGIRNTDGTLYQVGQPLPPNQLTQRHRADAQPRRLAAHQAALHRPGQPRLLEDARQRLRDRGRRRATPTARTSALRPNLNRRINGGARRFAGHPAHDVGDRNFRVDISEGRSHYKGHHLRPQEALGRQAAAPDLVHAVRDHVRRPASAPPTSSANTTSSTSSTPSGTQEARPARTPGTGSRAAAVWTPGLGLHVAPVFRYKSAKTPYNVITGRRRQPRRHQPRPARRAWRHVNSAPRRRLQAVRPAACPRSSGSASRARLELIAEVFNVFNAKNPGAFVGQHGGEQLRPADGVRGRLPARRAAAGPARHPLRVLAG